MPPLRSLYFVPNYYCYCTVICFVGVGHASVVYFDDPLHPVPHAHNQSPNQLRWIMEHYYSMVWQVLWVTVPASPYQGAFASQFPGAPPCIVPDSLETDAGDYKGDLAGIDLPLTASFSPTVSCLIHLLRLSAAISLQSCSNPGAIQTCFTASKLELQREMVCTLSPESWQP